jgi:hypothetical protein
MENLIRYVAVSDMAHGEVKELHFAHKLPHTTYRTSTKLITVYHSYHNVCCCLKTYMMIDKKRTACAELSLITAYIYWQSLLH